MITTTTTMTRSYSELMQIESFKDRYNYLKLDGRVGDVTLGYNRVYHQVFLKSDKWRSTRNKIIIRDQGRDLGVPGYEIEAGPIEVHHINPITIEDILNDDPKLYDPNNLISTSPNTHKAIHYSNENILITEPIKRSPNDTCPWKGGKR